MGRYICKTCKVEKDESSFRIKETRQLKSGLKSYRNHHCNVCFREIQNSQRKDRYPHAWIRNRYGVDDKTALYWYEKSMTFCEICGKEWQEGTERLCIDHNHFTQEIRGILCKHCNHVLGHSYEKIETLESSIVYLKKNGG